MTTLCDIAILKKKLQLSLTNVDVPIVYKLFTSV